MACHLLCGPLPVWQPRSEQLATLHALRLCVSQLVHTKEKLWKHSPSTLMVSSQLPLCLASATFYPVSGPNTGHRCFVSSLFLWIPPQPSVTPKSAVLTSALGTCIPKKDAPNPYVRGVFMISIPKSGLKIVPTKNLFLDYPLCFPLIIIATHSDQCSEQAILAWAGLT